MLTAGCVRLSARAARENELWRAIACSVRRWVTCKSIGKIYVMVRIKTIDFPDVGRCGTLGPMDSNLYALEKLVAQRLTEARATAVISTCWRSPGRRVPRYASGSARR